MQRSHRGTLHESIQRIPFEPINSSSRLQEPCRQHSIIGYQSSATKDCALTSSIPVPASQQTSRIKTKTKVKSRARLPQSLVLRKLPK